MIYSGFKITIPIITVLIVLVSCATVPKSEPQIIKMTCKLPTFAPFLETKEFQEKGGIQISLAPVLYECRVSNIDQTKPASPTIAEQLQGSIRVGNEKPKDKFVERSIIPEFQVVPDAIKFKVTISNKLPRVIRGAGVVVQYTIAGKQIAIDQKYYSELANLILAPRTEQQIEIQGPPLSSLPDQTIIGIFIYDVITKTDPAGNILEKQNFEWYFNYAVQIREETGEIQKSRGWI